MKLRMLLLLLLLLLGVAHVGAVTPEPAAEELEEVVCNVKDVFKKMRAPLKAAKGVGKFNFKRARLPEDCTTVDLRWAQVGDVGAEALAKAVLASSSNALTTLVLSENKIG